MATIIFRLSPKLYLRDPQASELGNRIIEKSIDLIDEVGNEGFNFNKLARLINSTEASIYRYFQNKQKLLLYLIDWYWTWLEFRLSIGLQNIASPEQKLKIVLSTLIEEKNFDPEIPYINERKLQRVAISEFEKTYLTKVVDSYHKDGLFLPYKTLCETIASVIAEINPDYRFPHSLASSVVLSINHQLYYSLHLPSLSDIDTRSSAKYEELVMFHEELVLGTIRKK